MAKQRIFELPETKGEFKARGLVTGTTKDKFFQSGLTRSGKKRNQLRFGIKVQADGSTVYCDLQPMEQDKVYFYKKGDKKAGIKGESKAVPFANRNLFKEEGFEPIGIKVGLEQYIDDKGSLKNKNMNMLEFDGAEYLSKALVEDIGVFARGKMEFSSYTKEQNGEKSKVRMTKFIPSQISAVTSDVNFEDEKFSPINDFIQTIVFMEAQLDDSDPEDKKGIISAKIVNYSTIEDAEFIIRDTKIFKTFKKNLKPYTAIQVFGKINNRLEVTEEVDDGWGSANNSFDHKANNFIKELLILGANPDTIDTETYTKEKMEEAMELIKANQKAKEDFGKTSEPDVSSDWGNNVEDSNDDGFDDGWG